MLSTRHFERSEPTLSSHFAPTCFCVPSALRSNCPSLSFVPPHPPVISNGASRLFLPTSLLRSGRLAKREISLRFFLESSLHRAPPEVFRQKLLARVGVIRLHQRQKLPRTKERSCKQNGVLPLFVHGVLVVGFVAAGKGGNLILLLYPGNLGNVHLRF